MLWKDIRFVLKYKLLFLDLDGTIVGKNDSISPRTLQAIASAEEMGCLPVLCTGRSRYTSKAIVNKIGKGYGIFLNGTIIAKVHDEGYIEKITLPLDIARRAVQIAHSCELAPLLFAVEEDDRWVYTDRPCPAPPDYLKRFPERMRIVDDLAVNLLSPPVSIETYGPAEATISMTSQWREEFGDEALIYEWEQGDYGGRGAHLQSSRAHKASAAQKVADLLKIPREQAIAIGDQINDMELLQWAGLGISMGDGHEEIRAAADFVTSSFANDGAAIAIEHFVFES